MRRQEQQEAFERQLQAEQAQFERKLALHQVDTEANLRLREAEIRSQERLARATARAGAAAEPAPAAQSRAIAGRRPALEPEEPLTCPACGYEAGNLNALKGHKRWCEAWKSSSQLALEPARPGPNGNGRY